MKRITMTYVAVRLATETIGKTVRGNQIETFDIENALEALELLRFQKAFRPSGSNFFPGTFYSSEAYHILRTGEDITHSFHLEGFTLAEQHAIFLHLTKSQEGYFAIVRTDWVGPAFAVGLSKDHAWEVFRNTREDMGIDPKLTEAEHFECVSITKQDADAILAGDTEAWEANV